MISDLEKMKIMQAIINGGKECQRRSLQDNDIWYDIKKPTWNWDRYQYRVKPDGIFLDKNIPMWEQMPFCHLFNKDGYIRISTRVRDSLKNGRYKITIHFDSHDTFEEVEKEKSLGN